MDFRVILTPTASEDLHNVVRFVAKNDRKAAEKLGNLLIDKAFSLARFPERGRMVPEERDEQIREISARPYRIIYYVDKALKEVYIVRFWHAARGEPDVTI